VQLAEGLRALFGEGNVRDRLADDAPVPLPQVAMPYALTPQ
jgi:hypothetical protein